MWPIPDLVVAIAIGVLIVWVAALSSYVVRLIRRLDITDEDVGRALHKCIRAEEKVEYLSARVAHLQEEGRRLSLDASAYITRRVSDALREIATDLDPAHKGKLPAEYGTREDIAQAIASCAPIADYIKRTEIERKEA